MPPRTLLRVLAGVLLVGMLALAAPIARAGLKPVLLAPIYVFLHSWGVNEYVRLINVQKHHPALRIVAIVNVDFDGSDWKNDPAYRGKMGEIPRSLDGRGSRWWVHARSPSAATEPLRGYRLAASGRVGLVRWTHGRGQRRALSG